MFLSKGETQKRSGGKGSCTVFKTPQLSDWLTITSQILLLSLTSRAYYNFSYRAIDLNEVIFDASFSRNQELVVPQLIRQNNVNVPICNNFML